VATQRERWDGGGYPHGRAGDAIPLGARIVGVVGAWGAMRSDRPYRRALTRDAATEEIRTGIGRAYCPRVAETFLKSLGPGRDTAGTAQA